MPKFKDFIDFLKEEDALEGYKIALKDSEKKIQDMARYVNKLAMVCRLDEAICSSFAWYPTKEGYQYWSELNVKWNNKIKELI